MDQEIINEVWRIQGQRRSDQLPGGYRIGPVGEMMATADIVDREPGGVSVAGDGIVLPAGFDEEFELPTDARYPHGSPAEVGIEAVAWYVSFHVSRTMWGIYFSEEALVRFARETLGAVPGLSDADRFLITWYFVLHHELFHYWVDVASAHMEFGAIEPRYLPYIENHPDLSSPLCQLEEALANERAYRRLRAEEDDQYVLDAFEEAMSRQPPGYSEWDLYTGARSRQGRQDLGAGIVSVSRPSVLGPYDWFFSEKRSYANALSVPVRWIFTKYGIARPYLGTYGRPITVTESNRFSRKVESATSHLQGLWAKTKRNLMTGDWSGTDFKKLRGRKDTYQCRVTRGHRAELVHKGSDIYEAQDFFPHR